MFQSEDGMKEQEVLEQLRNMRLTAKNSTTDKRVLAALREQSKMNKRSRRIHSGLKTTLAGVAGICLACGLLFVTVSHHYPERSHPSTTTSKHPNAQQHRGNHPKELKPAPAQPKPSTGKSTTAPATQPSHKTSADSTSSPSPIMT